MEFFKVNTDCDGLEIKALVEMYVSHYCQFVAKNIDKDNNGWSQLVFNVSKNDKTIYYRVDYAGQFDLLAFAIGNEIMKHCETVGFDIFK